jgi:hypothetical protein
LSTHHAAANHTLGVLHRDAALRTFHENDERHNRHHQRQKKQDGQRSKRAPRLGLGLFVKVKNSVWQTHHNAHKDDQRHSVADAALADLFAQPHDEGRTGGQRKNREQDEADPRVIYQRLARVSLRLQRGGDGGGLDDAQDNRQVARVLGNLAAAQFAFFLKALEVWEHHSHQLQDDRRGDVRHDAQRENRQPAEIAAAEQVEDAQHRTRGLLKQFRKHLGVDAGGRNVCADAVDRQQTQRKEQPVAQIFDPEEIRESL